MARSRQESGVREIRLRRSMRRGLETGSSGYRAVLDPTNSAFARWGAMALRWTVPMWAAILAGAILGGASGAFAWKQTMPSLEETRLRVELRYWISSGETARDNFIHELGLLRLGHHNAQIATHRARQIEQWRERLGAAIARQTVLRVEETTAFVMSTTGNRISDSIRALKVLLRDWRSFKR